MLITGCDFHTRYQQTAMVDDAAGELTERRLKHEGGEVNALYGSLGGGPQSIAVDIARLGRA
jgi:hypothetical protein